MACTSPLYAFGLLYYRSEKWFRNVDLPVPLEYDKVIFSNREEWPYVLEVYHSSDSVFFVHKGDFFSTRFNVPSCKVYPIMLPCRKCTSCLLSSSKEWASRLVLESLNWKNNIFLTLTYDDEHLPYLDITPDYFDVFPDEEELPNNPTLLPAHLQKFMKDFRRYLDYHYNFHGLRFYCAGEYGSKSDRPHYHIIVFNVPDEFCDTFHLETTNFRGERYFTSSVISQLWKYGFHVIGDLSYDSCSYVARYCLKKRYQYGDDYYLRKNVLPEFQRSSNRPGISRSYYDSHKDTIYDVDQILISRKGKNPLRVKPFSYYDRKFSIDDPEAMASIKAQRADRAHSQSEFRRKNNDKSDVEYLIQLDTASKEVLKKLPRKL